jgi:hypothetical protein
MGLRYHTSKLILKSAATLILILLVGLAKAQSTLSFVNLPVGAHVAASGGELVSSINEDLSVSFQNPALLDSVENTTYYVMFSPFLGEVNRYYVGYATSLENTNIISKLISPLHFSITKILKVKT